MIERRRPQVRGDALDRRNADVDQPDQRLEAIDGLTVDPIAAQRARRPRQLELDRRQRLPELVVQLAREVGALLLARRLDARGELPHLFLRLAQPLLLVGDVGAGADVADQFAARPEPRRAMANHPAVLTVGAAQPVLERVRRTGSPPHARHGAQAGRDRHGGRRATSPRPSSSLSDRPVNASHWRLKKVQRPSGPAIHSITGASSATVRKSPSASNAAISRISTGLVHEIARNVYVTARCRQTNTLRNVMYGSLKALAVRHKRTDVRS